MDDLASIIKRRSNPGILIFDIKETLLYQNEEARSILLNFIDKENDSLRVPEFIKEIIKQVKKNNQLLNTIKQVESSEDYFSIKAFPLGRHFSRDEPSHILILLEKVKIRREIDIKRIGLHYGLTNREIDILELIYEGFSNKEISKKLFISEYTVKDHLKNIMAKFDVTSRNKLIAKINKLKSKIHT